MNTVKLVQHDNVLNFWILVIYFNFNRNYEPVLQVWLSDWSIASREQLLQISGWHHIQFIQFSSFFDRLRQF